MPRAHLSLRAIVLATSLLLVVGLLPAQALVAPGDAVVGNGHDAAHPSLPVIAGLEDERPYGVLAECSGPTPSSEVTTSGSYGIGEMEVVELTSEVDGSVIQVGVVRPDAGADHESPVILQASPYFLSDLRDVDLRDCNPFLVDNYVQHGYTIAFVPTRGAGGNDSCPNLMGEDERADVDQAVTWVANQPWSNGNVGMIGLSYDGSTPWGVAATGNPHLKTIVPASGVHDLFDLIYYRGRNDGRWWFFVSGYYHYYGLALNTPLQGREPGRWVNAGLSCDDVDDGLQATLESYRTGEYDSLGYWEERNKDPDILERYRGSVLLVQGLQDWNVDPDHQYPFIEELEDRGVYVKHLLGQWAHEWPDSQTGARTDFADMLLRWWDRWLKEDRSSQTGPRAEVQDSELRWRAESTWPPRKSQAMTLHLDADGTLAEQASGETTSTTIGPSSRNRYFYLNDNSQVYNDLPIDRICVTCATFTYEVSGSDLHIAGIPELDLTLRPHGPSGHVAAFLFRVDGDDQRHLLGWGASDLRFPQGGREAQPVEPGDVMEMTLPLQPLDGVVRDGERVELVLDQGHADHMPSAVFFPVDVHHGGGSGAFRFETIEPKDKAFFDID